MPISHTDLLKEIKQKKFPSITLVYGEESLFIDQVLEAFEDSVLPESERSFNQFSIYGKDTSLAALVSMARRYPMMAERQLIVVREAQFLDGKGGEDKIAQELSVWEEYCKNPSPFTVLVLSLKSNVNARLKTIKALEAKGLLCPCPKVDEKSLGPWIRQSLSEYQISPQSMELLLGHMMGAELQKIQFELKKLRINLPEGSSILPEHIETHIGVHRQYNVFEYQKALLLGDVSKATKIAKFLSENPKQHPLPPMLALLFNAFSKLLKLHHLGDLPKATLAQELEIKEYFLNEYLQAKRRYGWKKTIQILEAIQMADLQFKGIEAKGNMDDAALLMDLNFRILH